MYSKPVQDIFRMIIVFLSLLDRLRYAYSHEEA